RLLVGLLETTELVVENEDVADFGGQ
ncbi:MAG: hypothetical protein QOH78_2364, partial [Verrucomicrobiota bacterium]